MFLKIGSICDDALEHDLKPVLTSDIRIIFSCNSRSAHFAEVRSKKGITGTEGDDCCLIFFFAEQDRGAVLTENTAYKTKQS